MGNSILKINMNRKFCINKETLACIALGLYFLKEPINSVLGVAFGYGTLRDVLLLILLYTPLLLMPLFKGEKRKITDFIILMFIIVLVFGVTYLFHPEYHYWFFEGYYPISEYIFYPTQYIFLYLFIRMVKNPENILKVLKVVCLILLVYYSIKLVNALNVGYWLMRSAGTDIPKKMAYNLTFGYDQLLLFTTFFYFGTKGKKIYFFLAGISFIEIILGGSRGPLIFIFVLFIIWMIKERKKIKDSKSFIKIILIMTLLSICVLVIGLIGIEPILHSLNDLLQKFGISSRTLMKIIDGSIKDDSGRTLLTATSIQMIKDGSILGYGAYGDRYVIGQFMATGYCHNILMELLIDFGVIIGGLLFIWLLVRSFKLLFCRRYGCWSDVFMIFFVCSCKLWLSSSFWYCEVFWAALAISVSANKWLRPQGGLYECKGWKRST